MHLIRFALLALLFCPVVLWAQTPSVETPKCGEAKVHLGNPEYLKSPHFIIAAEMPEGWGLDVDHQSPFYILKKGDTYKNAHVLMYVNVVSLDKPFQQVIHSDEMSFRKSCPISTVQDEEPPEILEAGCEHKTQLFRCDRSNNSYVDLVTEISIRGLLFNVVLSAENRHEIEQYRKDYEFLLKHLSLVASH